MLDDRKSWETIALSLPLSFFLSPLHNILDKYVSFLDCNGCLTRSTSYSLDALYSCPLHVHASTTHRAFSEKWLVELGARKAFGMRRKAARKKWARCGLLRPWVGVDHDYCWCPKCCRSKRVYKTSQDKHADCHFFFIYFCASQSRFLLSQQPTNGRYDSFAVILSVQKIAFAYSSLVYHIKWPNLRSLYSYCLGSIGREKKGTKFVYSGRKLPQALTVIDRLCLVCIWTSSFL